MNKIVFSLALLLGINASAAGGVYLGQCTVANEAASTVTSKQRGSTPHLEIGGVLRGHSLGRLFGVDKLLGVEGEDLNDKYVSFPESTVSPDGSMVFQMFDQTDGKLLGSVHVTKSGSGYVGDLVSITNKTVHFVECIVSAEAFSQEIDPGGGVY